MKITFLWRSTGNNPSSLCGITTPNYDTRDGMDVMPLNQEPQSQREAWRSYGRKITVSFKLPDFIVL